ncbi:hypothetical protein [Alphabaculovirus altersperidaniae]|uniref:Uncharacterized protein n=1 Tax=Spodoptera eridania nucleopolyhedrovirus TaxID=2315721 RepID=A0ABX6TPY4_9ABAC|nr:hypothetical protein QKS47_gp044 [Spodoptera eridania nucleopolyhedrovirus]QNV47793.1 hypothetical protein [Spodoptera eridania nucleopolyhedrovirus]
MLPLPRSLYGGEDCKTILIFITIFTSIQTSRQRQRWSQWKKFFKNFLQTAQSRFYFKFV